MAQQTINVGTVAGDNTGDPGRTAFIKANQNFTELYSNIGGSYYSVVSPIAYGAVGNGTTDDSAAVLAALQSGKIVDGGGLTYGISGTMQPSSFVGLRNANFIQLSPTTASVATLWIYNLSNWFIDSCFFNMGATQNTGASDDSSKSALRVTNAAVS